MLSIIIPTLQEAELLPHTLKSLKDSWKTDEVEIIIVDGGSTDATLSIARNFGVKILQVSVLNKAIQLNMGAAAAKGDTLLFLHSDSLLPVNWLKELKTVLSTNAIAGCWRLRFDHPHWFLRLSAWCTRFTFSALRFGDQGLFVQRAIFDQIEGYNESMSLLEDQDIVRRLKITGKFDVLPASIQTSARRYLKHGIFKTQANYFVVWMMYRLGFKQKTIVNYYKKVFHSAIS